MLRGWRQGSVITVLAVVATAAIVMGGWALAGSHSAALQTTNGEKATASPLSPDTRTATTTTTTLPVIGTSTTISVPIPSTTVVGAGAPPSPSRNTTVALENYGVQPGDLGVGWDDQGQQSTSLDLDFPPPACSPYARVLAARQAGVVHQYGFHVQNDSEEGSLSSTVIANPSAAAVAEEMVAVRQPAYSACAVATAEAWLDYAGTNVKVLHVSATPIGLVREANVVGWRALIQYLGIDGTPTFAMDIFYASGGRYLAKVRVALSGCQSLPAPGLALLPDEWGAVTAVGERTSGTSVSPIGGPGSDPCPLLSSIQVG